MMKIIKDWMPVKNCCCGCMELVEVLVFEEEDVIFSQYTTETSKLEITEPEGD